MEKVVVSAPATIANIGPGFDVYGLAVDSLDFTQEIWFFICK
jgi:homoserine kinase